MSRKLSKEVKRVTELVRQRMKESKATELLGFDVESVHDGRAIFRLDVHPRHKQIHGAVHGGILAALADTTAAYCRLYGRPAGSGTGHGRAENQLFGAGTRRKSESGRKSSSRWPKFHCDGMRDIQ